MNSHSICNAHVDVLNFTVAKAKDDIVIGVALVCVQVLLAHVSQERWLLHRLSDVPNHVDALVERAAHAHVWRHKI